LPVAFRLPSPFSKLINQRRDRKSAPQPVNNRHWGAHSAGAPHAYHQRTIPRRHIRLSL
jgi:hypothetical protein